MPIKAIRHFGDPVLVTPANEVVDFDKEIRLLVKDLTETMLDAPGAGLAAPQIGVPLRVFVWDVDGALGHLINPSLDSLNPHLNSIILYSSYCSNVLLLSPSSKFDFIISSPLEDFSVVIKKSIVLY